MPWPKNVKIKIISKLQLQMKGNPIHNIEWLILLSNLIILGTHKHNLNIDLGIQIQRLSLAILGNWSAGMKFSNHNNKRQIAKIHGTTTKYLRMNRAVTVTTRIASEIITYSFDCHAIPLQISKECNHNTVDPHLLQLLMKGIELT